MFENPGSKIKGVAVVFFVIMAISSFIGGIAIIGMGDSFTIIGLLVIAFGIGLSWLFGVFIYGYGQMIENSDMQVEVLEEIKQITVKETKPINNDVDKKEVVITKADSSKVFVPKPAEVFVPKVEKKYCKKCGAILSGTYCYVCDTENKE